MLQPVALRSWIAVHPKFPPFLNASLAIIGTALKAAGKVNAFAFQRVCVPVVVEALIDPVSLNQHICIPFVNLNQLPFALDPLLCTTTG